MLKRRMSGCVAVAAVVAGLLLLTLIWYSVYGRKSSSQGEMSYGGGMPMAERSTAEMPGAPPGGPMEAPAPTAGEAEEALPKLDSGVFTAQAQALDRKIIKTAELGIEVKSVVAAAQEVKRLYLEVGGTADSFEITQDPGRTPRLSAVLRVPSASYDRVMQRLTAESFGTVRMHRETGQDVTEEWVDLEARVRNARREEERYFELLKAARKVDDMLKVEQRIGEVRGQIERLEGRLKFLRNRVDLSTINLSLWEPEPAIAPEASQWKPGLHARRAWAGLVAAVKTLLTALIYFTIDVLPFLLVIGLIVWAIVRAVKRHSARAASGEET